MPTKLSLDFELITGTLYNNNYKLPFGSIYLKETPFEVLKFLVKDYQIGRYLDISTNERSIFNVQGIKGYYDLSIENCDLKGDLKGVIINNEIKKDVNLSFLHKLNLIKEQGKRKIEYLVKKYLVTTHTEYGPITGGLIPDGEIGGIGAHYSSETRVTDNYFEERKKSENPETEKQLSQILQYSRAILDNPKFSIKNLEELVSVKAEAV